MLITLPSGEKRFVWPELSAEERRELIRKSIDEFLRLLLDSEGENLLKVVLYGSVARNEEHEESDIDIFILLKNYDLDRKKHIYRLADDVGFELTHGRNPISPYMVAEDIYTQTKNRYALYDAIEEEGVVIYDANA